LTCHGNLPFRNPVVLGEHSNCFIWQDGCRQNLRVSTHCIDRILMSNRTFLFCVLAWLMLLTL
jgi:hypothetical protein